MRQLVLLTLALSMAPLASAQNPARGWFLGADAGLSRLDGTVKSDEFSASFEDDATTYTLHAGYRFNRILSLGAFFTDFGDFRGGDDAYRIDAQVNAVGVNFVGRYPLGEKVGLLGNVIAMYRRLDLTAELPDALIVEQRNNGLVVRLGLGVNYQFNPNVDLRLDVNHTRDIGYVFMLFGNPPLRFDGNLTSLTLGLRYKF